jgi:hypothetical protein
MAHSDAWEEKWRWNWRKECVDSTLHTTSEYDVSSITTADAHTSAASSRLNWRPRRFKWTRPFRRKTKSVFCACAITIQTQSKTYLTYYRITMCKRVYSWHVWKLRMHVFWVCWLNKIITDSKCFEGQNMKFQKYDEFFFETSAINKRSVQCNRQEAWILKVRAAEIANLPLAEVSRSFQDLMAKPFTSWWHDTSLVK